MRVRWRFGWRSSQKAEISHPFSLFEPPKNPHNGAHGFPYETTVQSTGCTYMFVTRFVVTRMLRIACKTSSPDWPSQHNCSRLTPMPFLRHVAQFCPGSQNPGSDPETRIAWCHEARARPTHGVRESPAPMMVSGPAKQSGRCPCGANTLLHTCTIVLRGGRPSRGGSSQVASRRGS